MTSAKTNVYPVIHYRDNDLVLRNAEMADSAGCAGVFLIHMEGVDHLLDSAILAVRARFPSLMVGVNRLGTDPVEGLRRDAELGAHATWSDDCGVHSSGVSAWAGVLAQTLGLIRQSAPNYLYFGAVAFKYQKPEPDPVRAAQLAGSLSFLATTSGSATGSAPSVAKIAKMGAAVGRDALAIASGITPENAADFRDHSAHWLVSTGISQDFHSFDPARLQALMRVAQASSE
jgi:hypothetical protein